jgi:hypothetical protein
MTVVLRVACGLPFQRSTPARRCGRPSRCDPRRCRFPAPPRYRWSVGGCAARPSIVATRGSGGWRLRGQGSTTRRGVSTAVSVASDRTPLPPLLERAGDTLARSVRAIGLERFARFAAAASAPLLLPDGALLSDGPLLAGLSAYVPLTEKTCSCRSRPSSTISPASLRSSAWRPERRRSPRPTSGAWSSEPDPRQEVES